MSGQVRSLNIPMALTTTSAVSSSPLSRERVHCEVSSDHAARFTALPRAELLALLRSAKIAYGELNDVAGLSRHPVLRRVEVDTPSGPVRLAAPPQAGGGPLGPVPAIDAHGQAIREEFAA